MRAGGDEGRRGEGKGVRIERDGAGKEGRRGGGK